MTLANFTDTVDAAFQALGEKAVFRPAVGPDIPDVLVIPAQPADFTSLAETTIRSDTALFDVRVSQIADPREGAEVILESGARFRVQKKPDHPDRRRLVWRLDTRELV